LNNLGEVSVKRSSHYEMPLYKRQELHFECTRCGVCCTGNADAYVLLWPGEAEALCAELGLSWAWFRRHYLRRDSDGDLVLRMREEQGRCTCILLGADGQCRAYQARPIQCRTYPFWPELLRSAKAWEREAKRCEGIGRGERVPLERIEAALKEQGK
jgi:Fe-S-cluster containining protein